jgi:acyl-coenzyme A synthetase/AMP-(fatty) acid ligase
MGANDTLSLRDALAKGKTPRFFWDRGVSVSFTDLNSGTCLGAHLSKLSKRSVLLATARQLTSALALIELDGVASRIVILPPDAPAEHLDKVIASAGVEAVVIDDETPMSDAIALPLRATCRQTIMPTDRVSLPRVHTQWVLLTSGTTGVPKMVVHDFASLTAPIRPASPADGADVWGTFYDIRRFGGLQIYFRALCGDASLVLSSAGEPVAEHLDRLQEHKVTHLSGTPSQWRRAMMMPKFGAIAPRYVRLSGEIPDQTVLDSLGIAFPQAAIGHAYASTEAGVAFDVNDGRGFPADYIGPVRHGVAMQIIDGSLRIRSPAAASAYVGGEPLADPSGFIDTGDIVERRGDRFYFVGRKGGIINVGGLKVHPEEVEAVINRHPLVRMSLARGRQNPVTGSIVVADVVLIAEEEGDAHQRGSRDLKDDIVKLCRQTLPPHKVPAAITFVPSLNLGTAGKLLRRQ